MPNHNDDPAANHRPSPERAAASGLQVQTVMGAAEQPAVAKKAGTVQVLVHNIGHHDLWLLRGSPKPMPVEILFSRMQEDSARVLRLVEERGLQPDLTAAIPGVYGYGRAQRASSSAEEDVGFVLSLLPAALATWPESSGPDHVVMTYSCPQARDEAKAGTREVALLLRRYVNSRLPATTVHLIEGLASSPFQLDAVTPYIRDRVVPCLERLQRAAMPGGFEVILSANTGTPPMVQGLASALARFRATAMYIPSAKAPPSLRTPLKVEHQSWASLTQAPVTDVAQVTDPVVQLCANELRAYAQAYAAAFAQSGPDADSDLQAFWLRKSLKPVLAVLVVRDEAGALAAFRGCNLEPSMPTGSLCAERSAIAQALATRPSLKRSQILAAGVLGMPNPKGDATPFLEPCGVCHEWLSKIAEVNNEFRVVLFQDRRCERVSVRWL